jgi:hypothetical protein
MLARLLAVFLVATTATHAAEITDVATAGDANRPFEIDLAATFSHTRTQTKITREANTPAGVQLQDELTHVRTLDATDLRLAVGLWHDLELHGLVKVALHDEQTWSYAPGVTAASSSLTSNKINVSGCASASCLVTQPIVAVPGQSEHTGLFSPTIGIAWKPINEWREQRVADELFVFGRPVATWVIAFDYTLPVGGRLNDPSRFAIGKNAAGASGEATKASVLALSTAFSKRYEFFEPYLRFEGDYSFASSDSYDNCSHPELLSSAAAANCGGSFKGQTGYQPPVEVATTLGTEVVVFEDRKADRRVAIDLRSDLRWHGPQRGYTQMTDALGKLTYSEEYLTGTGQLGVYGRISRWFHARVYGMLGADTAHFLTTEDPGSNGGTGQNPNFDFRTDQPGHRLRAEPAVFWGISGTLSADF